MALSSVASPHKGHAFAAVPSESTGWWPCLHKPDFKSCVRTLLDSVSSLALKAAVSLSKFLEMGAYGPGLPPPPVAVMQAL